MAGSAGRQPERRRGRESAALGKPRFFFSDTERQVFPRVALRQAGHRRKKMEPRGHRSCEEADDLNAARHQGATKQEVVYTIECGGNHGFPWFTSGIGTAKWGGTPLAPLLKQAGVMDRGIEVVFWGADAGVETVRDMKMPQHFARSMSLVDAMSPNNLLCYEMNGVALPQPHGAPVRLIAPGWYGIANTKWLNRIEVRDTRYMGRFMARDYVTIREEQRNGDTEFVESSVGRTLLKSAPAKVTRKDGQYRIVGAAWGAPVARVEVQVDGGPWRQAAIDKSEQGKFAWTFWSVDWPNATPGEHTITSRAVDTQGNVQPAMDASQHCQEEDLLGK